jgi:hypothetical protein
MKKARKTGGKRQTTRRTSKTIEDSKAAIQNLQLSEFNFTSNDYIRAVASNIAIALAILGTLYEVVGYFGESALPQKVAVEEVSPPGRMASRKSKQATAVGDQSKKVKAEEPSSPIPAVTGTTAFVSGNNVLIRANPKLNAKIVGKAIFGTSIEVIAYDGNWVQINSPAQNLSGWTEKMRLNF